MFAPITPSLAFPSSLVTLSSTGPKAAIIGGIVGGLGGLVLFIILVYFLCVRRRRRQQHARPLDWERVNSSLLFHAHPGGAIPASPSSATLSVVDAPLPMSEAPHAQHATVRMSTHVRPLETSGIAAAATYSVGANAKTTAVSPLLMVHATSPLSEESFHTAEDGDAGGGDPFADPAALARMRPRVLNASPTIRVSDATFVDEATRMPGWRSVAGRDGGGGGGGGVVDSVYGGVEHVYDGIENGENSDRPKVQTAGTEGNLLLMPASALGPLAGKQKRLSHGSEESTPASPTASSENVAVSLSLLYPSCTSSYGDFSDTQPGFAI
jgi:hypothetical protein